MSKLKSDAVKKIIKKGKVVNCSDAAAREKLEEAFTNLKKDLPEEVVSKLSGDDEPIHIEEGKSKKDKKKDEKPKKQLKKLTKRVKVLEEKTASMEKDLKDTLELMKKISDAAQNFAPLMALLPKSTTASTDSDASGNSQECNQVMTSNEGEPNVGNSGV